MNSKKWTVSVNSNPWTVKVNSVFSTFWIRNFWTFCLFLGPNIVRRSMTKGISCKPLFFFKRFQYDIFCWLYRSLCQTHLLITSHLFIYHHGLWLFRRILNIVIILVVVQARQIVAVMQARQIGESKSSAESEVSWISSRFSATYLWRTIKYFGFCASQTNKVAPVL